MYGLCPSLVSWMRFARRREIGDEVRGVPCIALPDEPANHQLGIGVNCYPGPRIASNEQREAK